MSRIRQVECDVLLSPYSFLRVGGPAKFFAEVKTIEECAQAFLFVHGEGVSFRLVGFGSNLFFDDRGYDGCIIINKMQSIERRDSLFIVDAGVSSSYLGRYTVQEGYSGLAFLLGIPGSVGGAVVMNAGTPKGQTADCLKAVDFMHPSGEIEHIVSDALHFGYRYSCLQEKKGVVLRVYFSLKEALPLEKEEQMAEFYLRRQKQPYGLATLGSTFKNPKGNFAGRLIEQAGFKGKKCGEIMVSSQHANFFINTGKGSSEDMRRLMQEVQEGVFAQFGIWLEPEVIGVPYSEKI